MTEAVVDLEDARVLKAIRAGDVDAYAKLMVKYQGRVSGIVSGHAPRERVSELTHEVFVRAYRSLAGYRGDSPFGHWLAKVTVRTCHDFWRSEYRRRERPESELSDECRAFAEEAAALETSEAAEESASRSEARELLAWAMDKLSPTDRMTKRSSVALDTILKQAVKVGRYPWMAGRLAALEKEKFLFDFLNPKAEMGNARSIRQLSIRITDMK